MINIPQILFMYTLSFGYATDFVQYNGSYEDEDGETYMLTITFVTNVIAIFNLGESFIVRL